MRAFILGKRASAVSLLALLALVTCRLITAEAFREEASLQAAAASAVKALVVVGDRVNQPKKDNPQIAISTREDGLPLLSLSPPMRVLTISVYDTSTNALLWAAVPESFEFQSGTAAEGGVPKRARAGGHEGFDLRSDHNGVAERDEELLRSAGVVVKRFVYGIAPAGFRQLTPPGAVAPSLQPGEYLVVVVGESSLRELFRIPRAESL